MKAKSNKMTVITVAIAVAVVVIIALWLNTKVDVNIEDGKMNLSADKNKQQDVVLVKEIDKSKVDIENRKDQNINVEGVKNDSDVKIK